MVSCVCYIVCSLRSTLNNKNFLIINKIKNSNLFLIELLDKVGGLSLKKVHLKSAYNIILWVLVCSCLGINEALCQLVVDILVENILTTSQKTKTKIVFRDDWKLCLRHLKRRLYQANNFMVSEYCLIANVQQMWHQ